LDKILLLNPPGDKLYQRDLYCSAVSKAFYYWPSIDLLIQSGILGERYDVHVLDAIAERLTPEDCTSRIRQADYKAILFLTGTASWRKDLDYISRFKAGPNPPLLIGNGDILLFKAREFLERHSFLDAVLLDYTTPDVLHFLEGNYASRGNNPSLAHSPPHHLPPLTGFLRKLFKPTDKRPYRGTKAL